MVDVVVILWIILLEFFIIILVLIKLIFVIICVIIFCDCGDLILLVIFWKNIICCIIVIMSVDIFINMWFEIFVVFFMFCFFRLIKNVIVIIINVGIMIINNYCFYVRNDLIKLNFFGNLKNIFIC